MENVVIIGAGASGLFAGIMAAKKGAKVLILEHREKAGKKILMTGNGKCNLTNMNDFHGKYYSENIKKAYKILEKLSPQETRNLFCELGLFTKEKRDGGVYPVSEQASGVLDVLLSSCKQYGVKILLNADAKKIFAKEHRLEYIQDGERKQLSYNKLILATGGKTASATGSDGSGYYLSGQLGHKAIEPLPALVQLKCKQTDFKLISGVRTQAGLSLFIDDRFIQAEEGELQLTDNGISGIPVFQFSRNAAIALFEKKKVEVKINFLSYLSKEQKAYILEHYKDFSNKSIEEYLCGFLNRKLCIWFLKQMHMDAQTNVLFISENQIRKWIDILSSYKVIVTDTNPMDQAQVTRGGISLDEIDDTLQSKFEKDVYMIGEVLDCDGICGGYNLQWAWTTAWIAANAVLKI